jgi:hypothetical protein
VWPRQLGELTITATVTRVDTGERKTSHLAVAVVQTVTFVGEPPR